MTDKETRMKMTSHLAVIGLLACAAGSALAQARREITVGCFFGSCEADYGKSIDVKAARGECGIITTLVNKFNATNKDNIVVKPQIVEWGPSHAQRAARIGARDVPPIAFRHQPPLGHFAHRNLIEPMDDSFKSV